MASRKITLVLVTLLLMAGIVMTARPGEAKPTPGVDKIQYQDSSGNFVGVPNPLYVALGSTVTFKALPKTGTTFPTGKPSWGGASASSTDETSTATFNTLSTSATDYKTVSAECNNTVTVNVVVLQVNLSVNGLNEDQDEAPGAAVMVNDDMDNGQLSSGASGPLAPDYRPLEPLLDFDVRQTVAQENDLLAVTLSVSPGDLGGTATMSVSNPTNIRLWEQSTKGSTSMTLPVTYAVASSKTVYVEGKQSGSLGVSTITLNYTKSGSTFSDTLNINVVSLAESQGGQRRVINSYNAPIQFEVSGGPSDAEYRWDLDGDGNRAAGAFEQGVTSRTRSVSYGPSESATSVLLPRDAAHRRQDYNVSVQLTGGLVLSRNIHVALDTYYGTPLTGTTVAQRQAEITSIGSAVGSFDNTPPNTAPPGDPPIDYSQEWLELNRGITLNVNAGNRLQYAPLVTANGQTEINLLPGYWGNARRVYAIYVGPSVYTTRQTREDVSATINHENQHVSQMDQIRDNSPASNAWRLLDVLYLGDYGSYANFAEADGHRTEVDDANIGWYHLRGVGQNDVVRFHGRYTAAVDTDLQSIANTTARAAARASLQDMYQNISPALSPQMKTYGRVKGYDFFVRPPQ